MSVSQWMGWSMQAGHGFTIASPDYHSAWHMRSSLQNELSDKRGYWGGGNTVHCKSAGEEGSSSLQGSFLFGMPATPTHDPTQQMCFVLHYFKMYTEFVSSQYGKTHRHKNNCHEINLCYIHNPLETGGAACHTGPHRATGAEMGRQIETANAAEAFTVVFTVQNEQGKWSKLKLNNFSRL